MFSNGHLGLAPNTYLTLNALNDNLHNGAAVGVLPARSQIASGVNPQNFIAFGIVHHSYPTGEGPTMFEIKVGDNILDVPAARLRHQKSNVPHLNLV